MHKSQSLHITRHELVLDLIVKVRKIEVKRKSFDEHRGISYMAAIHLHIDFNGYIGSGLNNVDTDLT